MRRIGASRYNLAKNRQVEVNYELAKIRAPLMVGYTKYLADSLTLIAKAPASWQPKDLSMELNDCERSMSTALRSLIDNYKRGPGK